MSSEQNISEDNYQIIRGWPFPKVQSFPKKNIEDAMDYVPKDGDIAVASYPKTGSTWMQYIVLQIVSRGESFPSFDDVTFKFAPFLEMSGIAAVEALESKPRIYKHHIPYNMVQKNDKSKCIYIYRNPEDTVVSFYHFLKSVRLESFDQMDFNKFFDDYVTGNVDYGSYFKHLLSFYEHREDDNLLMISYEKLHAGRKEGILEIAKFLGEEYYAYLLDHEDVLHNIIKHTSFDHMKKNLHFNSPGVKEKPQDSKPTNERKINFFRKGVVGDGKNVLTDDQRQRLKEAALKILNGTSIIEEWYSG